LGLSEKVGSADAQGAGSTSLLVPPPWKKQLLHRAAAKTAETQRANHGSGGGKQPVALLPIIDAKEELRTHDVGQIRSTESELGLAVRLLEHVDDVEVDANPSIEII